MGHLYRSSLLLITLLMGLGVALFGMAGQASAHAKVLSATPGIGSTIASTPDKVTVETAENINPDPKLSNLFVYGPSGELISQGDAKVNLNNPKEMSVAIKPEKDGTYIVRWITASAQDNDPDQGAFFFAVKAGASSSSVAPAPQQTAPTPTANNSFPVLPVTLTGIIALVLGLAAGFGLGRNRAAAAAHPTSTTIDTREEAGTKGS